MKVRNGLWKILGVSSISQDSEKKEESRTRKGEKREMKEEACSLPGERDPGVCSLETLERGSANTLYIFSSRKTEREIGRRILLPRSQRKTRRLIASYSLVCSLSSLSEMRRQGEREREKEVFRSLSQKRWILLSLVCFRPVLLLLSESITRDDLLSSNSLRFDKVWRHTTTRRWRRTDR